MTAGTTITSTNIESAAYNNVHDVVDNRNNIADPRASGASHRDFVYDSDPFHKSLNFGDLPYIVLDLPTIEYLQNSNTSDSFDGKHRFIRWSQTITIRTARDGSAGNLTDTGRTDMQAIADDLHETFNSRTIIDSLMLLGVQNIFLRKETVDVLTVEQRSVYEAVYVLEYTTRVKTSS